jgi:hypothetical protein
MFSNTLVNTVDVVVFSKPFGVYGVELAKAAEGMFQFNWQPLPAVAEKWLSPFPLDTL